MALDSVAERTEHLKSAAVYTAFPKDGALSLVRLSRWGVPLENVIPIDDQAGQAFLAVRTAQSGWMNVVRMWCIGRKLVNCQPNAIIPV